MEAETTSLTPCIEVLQAFSRLVLLPCARCVFIPVALAGINVCSSFRTRVTAELLKL